MRQNRKSEVIGEHGSIRSWKMEDSEILFYMFHENPCLLNWRKCPKTFLITVNDLKAHEIVEYQKWVKLLMESL